MGRIGALRFGLLAAAALALTGCATASEDRGQRLAREKCAACHSLSTGAGARAGAPGFSQISVRHSRSSLERELQAISAVGHYDMPRTVLTQGEVESLVSYLMRHRPPDDRNRR